MDGGALVVEVVVREVVVVVDPIAACSAASAHALSSPPPTAPSATAFRRKLRRLCSSRLSARDTAASLEAPGTRLGNHKPLVWPGLEVLRSVWMVTFGEFVQHILTSGIVMAVSLVVLVIAANRWDDGHAFLRKALIALPICIGLVAFLSLTAGVTEARCQSDPREFCRFNDNIPFMAMVVFGFVLAVLVRALLVFFYRPVTTSDLFEKPPSHTRRREPRAQG